ncbi:unnamed protein product [Bemisia tabaci]|uniref:Uncharacterized protein n=1 Tax=Bemisia tabaci TaxID=7038 RepID=A0A9P0A2Q8_BEMTA|nr:unnamed protein product [Bemisia tabaci]
MTSSRDRLLIVANEQDSCVCKEVSGNEDQVTSIIENVRLLKVIESSDSTVTDSGQVSTVKHLNLSNCQLRTIDPSLALLTNLSELDLSGNKLSALPETLVALRKLHTLNLSGNSFEITPDIVTKLGFLRKLDLSNNPLSSFEVSLNCLGSLKWLNLSCTRLQRLPKWLFTDSRVLLEVLILSQNQCFSEPIDADVLYHFGHSLSFFSKSLKELDLTSCRASSKDLNVISYFDNLQCLKIGNKKDIEYCQFKLRNCMWDLPPSLLSNKNMLASLVSLHISDSSLSTLSEDIYLLSSLKELDISYNELNWLPSSFPKLINLEILNLSHNQLSLLPWNFSNLVNLKKLFVSHNKLDTLPEGFDKLELLEYADFYSNNIETFPQDVIESLVSNHLIGFDLAWNNCCPFSCDIYPPLQTKYRSSFVMNEARENTRCPIIEIPDNYSDSSSYSSYDGNTPPIEVEHEPHDIEEENWDDEYSFDERFDPNLSNLGSRPASVLSTYDARGPTPPVGYHIRDDIGPLYYPPSQMPFCPSDSHPPSIRKSKQSVPENCPLQIDSEQFEDV